MNASLQLIGYGTAGLVFAVLAVLLARSFTRGVHYGVLLAAVIVSAVWAFGLAYETVAPNPSVLRVLTLEASFDGAWLLFIATLLGGGTGAYSWLVRFGGVLFTASMLLVGLALELAAPFSESPMGAGSVLVVGSLITSLFGLVNLEQIFRNARANQLRSLKYLCLGLGGLFAYDLLLFSNAILTDGRSDLGWAARGFVALMCVPLLAVAARRAPAWSGGMFVSRHVVFYSATLLGAGVYLTLLGLVGYYIRDLGGDWGGFAQLILTVAALLALCAVLVSSKVRAKLRVFISKHFFENKYDYRVEWLRLIDTLTSDESSIPLRKRAIRALAQIIDAQAGLLWMEDKGHNGFACASSWNTQVVQSLIPAREAFPRSLQATGWVIERSEYVRRPDRCEPRDLSAITKHLEDFDIIVPLLHEGQLLGFVSLFARDASITLTFEDRDLLKTAGKQIASYLAQDIATEQLAENRQFEAFNKLTAYLMHDLKNLIAQQSLVVENAQRHGDKPEFIKDAVDTIRGGVVRMRRVLEQLQYGASARPSQRIELGRLVMRAVSQCTDRDPTPRALIGDKQIWVRADEERLQMAVYHAIRNAQDATAADGSIRVEVEPRGEGECTVSVIDNGCGMDKAFIRERLFRPFDSTKGTAGMGIGAYQIRETLEAFGGRLEVESARDRGTRLTMLLSTAS